MGADDNPQMMQKVEVVHTVAGPTPLALLVTGFADEEIGVPLSRAQAMKLIADLTEKLDASRQ